MIIELTAYVLIIVILMGVHNYIIHRHITDTKNELIKHIRAADVILKRIETQMRRMK